MRRFCKHDSMEFNAKTQPLADFYQKASSLRRIDGNRDRDAVFADISRLIEQVRHDPDQEQYGKSKRCGERAARRAKFSIA